MVRILTKAKVLATLLLITQLPLPADTADWKAKVDAYISRQDFASAEELLLSQKNQNPRDLFLWKKLSGTAQTLAERGHGKEHWRICGEAYAELGQLEPSEISSHNAWAIWCYWNVPDEKKIIELSPPVLAAPIVASPGSFGWSLSLFYIMESMNREGKQEEARSIFERTFPMLEQKDPEVQHLLYPVSGIYASIELTKEEKRLWFDRILRAAKRGKDKNAYGGAIAFCARLALDLADAEYEKGNYPEASKVVHALLDQFDAYLIKADPNLRDNLEIRRLAFDYRLSHQQPGPRFRRKLTVIAVNRSTGVLKTSDGQELLVSGNMDTSRATQQMLRRFRIFSDLILALTNGETLWEVSGVQHLPDHSLERIPITWDPVWKRYLANSLSLGNFEPVLTPDQLSPVEEADAVALVWPGLSMRGTNVTSGGVSQHTWSLRGRELTKAVFIAGAGTYFDAASSALWFPHEFFHLIEQKYPQENFPKNDHPCFRRNEWPKDYAGSTEWDFYWETYRKRVLPRDNMRRMKWTTP